MTLVWGVLLGVAALAAVIAPFLISGRQAVEVRKPIKPATRFRAELDAEVESGVVSREELSDLAGLEGLAGDSRADREGGAASVDEEIERRVREMRQRKAPLAGAVSRASGKRPEGAGRCPKCGKQVKSGDRFCVACGSKL